MTEVVSIKFKNRGKCYFFSPKEMKINTGDKVIVETSKGLELAECSRGNHPVPDSAVVQPLRPVVRIATNDDLRVEQINKQKEKEAFAIAEQKILEHKLDMKLVDVECNFEGSKTTFFFTSDGRVDFRDLVKDLAGVFRNRIELRQIGVRDEAKMIGGIGICGRPYCCNQFLEEFQPVSTKMAKVQSLSLNPTKISGSCGRLMCCLRYEEDAYEDLMKKVPKQGAFVETKDGYGTAVQINLLRQTVKVKLDTDTDDSLHLYKANELAQVPGGRPKDGEAPAHVFEYVPAEEETEEFANEWTVETEKKTEGVESVKVEVEKKPRSERTQRRNKPHPEKNNDSETKSKVQHQEKQQEAKAEITEGSLKPHHNRNRHGNHSNQHSVVKPVKEEAKPEQKKSENTPKQQAEGGEAKKRNNNRHYYHNRNRGKKPDGAQKPQQ